MRSKLSYSTLQASVALALAMGGTSVQAQSTGQSVSEISEIIVTARRVEESLQDVPISMTVIDPGQITDRNIVVAADLATYTPSLSVNQRYGAEKSTFALRGFNQDQSTAPTVGVYFADVVGVRSQGGTTSGNTVGAGAFTDLQNVQVLKGPQGTLFGRNTTGGAVLLVPQKPTYDFGGNVEVQAGDYDLRRVQAALNTPVSDTFRMRFALDSNHRDGYMKNQSGIGPDDYNDVNYIYGRVSAVWDITPNVENYTIAHYSKSETNGYASHYKTCNPAAAGAGAIIGPLACLQIARQAARGDDEFDVEVGHPDPRFLIQTWQIINTTTWKATDSLTVKNIASYGEFKERSRFNLYSDNFSFPDTFPVPALRGTPFNYIVLDDAPGGDDTAGQYTVTEELQLQGTAADGRFNWVAGGYLEFSRPIGWNAQRTGILLNCTDATTLNCSDPLNALGSGGTVSNSRTKFKFDNHGIFAQGTYNFTDQWAATVGGRWTFDTIKGVGESTRFVGFPGGAIQFCNDTVRFQGPGPGGSLVVTDPSQCRLGLKNKSDKPTWLVGLDYKPTDDLLIYGKYARGYRQGGLSFTNIGLEAWQPEKVDAYELGSKLSFSSDVARGYLNAAVFYNDFQDQQIFASTIAAAGTGAQAGAAVIVNAGKSVIQGLEIDSSVLLFEALRFDLGYTYLDTELKKLAAQTPPPGSPFTAIIPSANLNDPLTLSPKHRVTLAATYTLPFPESVGKVSIGSTYVHTSKQIANGGVPEDVGVIPTTDLVNINVNWESIFQSTVDVGFFMTNATDEKYPVNTGGGYVSSGIGDVLMGAPRMYGFRVRYNFGQ
jgi:iron complex outermembrane receptor protein